MSGINRNKRSVFNPCRKKVFSQIWYRIANQLENARNQSESKMSFPQTQSPRHVETFSNADMTIAQLSQVKSCLPATHNHNSIGNLPFELNVKSRHYLSESSHLISCRSRIPANDLLPQHPKRLFAMAIRVKGVRR